MRVSRSLLQTAAGCAAIALSATHVAKADTVTVNATDSVYAAGNQSGNAPSYGATAPLGIAVASGTSYVTFSATGVVTVNGVTLNDADGLGSVSGEYDTGTSALSGITSPTAGFIAGVFLGPGGPTGAVPTALDFRTSGLGTSFASLDPMLNQVFFIGDGKTGDGTGATQLFYVPTGATELYLGLADACGYTGAPGCYYDNAGTFATTVTAVGGVVTPPVGSPVPEPSSIMLLGTGVLGAAGALRRRFQGR